MRSARGGGRAGEASRPTPGTPADLGPDADAESVTRAICLRLLTAAPRTRAQLTAALTRRGVPEDVGRRVLDRLTEVGLVDDRAYARAWVRSRHAGRGLARRALGSELRARGIPDDLIASALAQLRPDDEASAARALVTRRLGASRGLPPPARIRRLTGMLARKGYPSGLALRVVREALDEEREGLGRVDPSGGAPAGFDEVDDN